MRFPSGRLVLWSIPHGTVPAGPTDLPAEGEYRVRVIRTGGGPQAEVLRGTYGFEDPRSISGLESFLIQMWGIKGAHVERVMDGVPEWQNRPLDTVCLVVFTDSIHVKIRDGAVANRRVYVTWS